MLIICRILISVILYSACLTSLAVGAACLDTACGEELASFLHAPPILTRDKRCSADLTAHTQHRPTIRITTDDELLNSLGFRVVP
jgi:hypothetical protein